MKHTITIKAVLNGFHVTVGCQSLAFESRKSLLRELERFLEDPGKIEKEYRESAIHKILLTDPQPAYVTGRSRIFSNTTDSVTANCANPST